MTRAILLTNLGSPTSPDTAAVRRYLNEFLMDPAVISLPWPLRRMLVSLICLTRPARSAEAYRSIWMADAGSPLIHHSRALAEAVTSATEFPVEVAMRYGTPSFEEALGKLAERGGIQEVLVLPLYPQYANSTTGTTLAHVRKLAARILPGVDIRFRPAFYDAEAWLELYGQFLAKHLPKKFDHVLFSYHGLPEQHIRDADPTGTHCLAGDDCCERSSTAHSTCYRHQCRVTSAGLARHAGLGSNQWSVSFQSRLGRQKWLEPATDAQVRTFAEQGMRHIAVACPAFVADNLETLEEIGIQARETFLEAGGESLTLIPCLNANSDWAALVASWCNAEWPLLDDPQHPYNRSRSA